MGRRVPTVGDTNPLPPECRTVRAAVARQQEHCAPIKKEVQPFKVVKLSCLFYSGTGSGDEEQMAREESLDVVAGQETHIDGRK